MQGQGQGPTRQGSMQSLETVLVYVLQVVTVLIVVCAAIYNLSRRDAKDLGMKDIWLILLSSSYAYMMPNPKLKKPGIERADTNDRLESAEQGT